VTSTRRARGQPARGARSQGGNEYLATEPLGLAGMDPRREEITASSQLGQARTPLYGRCTDAGCLAQHHSRSEAGWQPSVNPIPDALQRG